MSRESQTVSQVIPVFMERSVNPEKIIVSPPVQTASGFVGGTSRQNSPPGAEVVIQVPPRSWEIQTSQPAAYTMPAPGTPCTAQARGSFPPEGGSVSGVHVSPAS